MKKLKSKESQDQLDRTKAAATRSNVPHEPYFATKKPSEGTAVDTLSELNKGIEENIKARPVLQKAEEIAKKEALAPKPKIGKITKQANEAYKNVKDMKMGKAGKFGILSSLLGMGVAAFAPESKAADIVSKVSEAASESDPSTYLDRAMKDDSIEKHIEALNKKKKEQEQLQNEVKPMVKAVGGEPDMKPKKALELSGEQESPDLEEMDNVVNYKEYLEKIKRQMGF